MGAIATFVEMIDKYVGTARYVANIGKPQLIKQLEDLRINLENFKAAARRNDKSAMRQLLGECDMESKMLEKRLFKGLDTEMTHMLARTVKRAHAAKTGHVSTVARPVSKKAIRETLSAKRAELAKTMNARKEESRQRLIEELDAAIGRLRGISKSLENLSL